MLIIIIKWHYAQKLPAICTLVWLPYKNLAVTEVPAHMYAGLDWKKINGDAWLFAGPWIALKSGWRQSQWL